ncbi:MAG: YncE family protein [Gemmatimonas sp.]|nr:YncE family protein [Gemmatimonas sp.]
MKRAIVPTLLVLTGGCAAAGPGVVPGPEPSGAPAEGTYDVWVTSESADQVARIRFGPDGAEVVQSRDVGSMPVEIDGPHGVAVSPDGRYVYVTIGHGQPFGSLWKIDAETDEVLGRTLLGLFPATVSVTPDGEYAFISNFNLHGDPVPSSISKVHLGTMAEVARTETCVMPHGSRINPQGTRHYSVCMMDQLLVEIDVATGEVLRGFSVERRRERPAMPGDLGTMRHDDAAAELCNPTWAEPSADGSSVFVTCNRAQEVLEVDVEEWQVVRRFATGDAPYNLATTPDGRYLLVSLRNGADPALEVYDLQTGEPAGRVPASTTLVHGIAVSPDSRYAFVSVEGVGSEPGKVDIVDLSTMQRVASVEVAQQATGIAIAPTLQ